MAQQPNPKDPPSLPPTLARVLQDELQALEESQRDVLLCSGERIGMFADRFYYRFEIPEHLVFHSVATAQFSFGTTDPLNVTGHIVAVENQYLTAALPLDFGHVIPETRCSWDFAPQIRPVIDMLSSMDPGLSVPSLLLNPTGGSNLHAVGFDPVILPDTPAEQQDALKKIFQNRVTFVWGPILSGKTHLLAHIAANYVKAGKRILFVDTVNERVDDVLLRSIELGEKLGVKMGPATCSMGLPAVENFEKLSSISLEQQVENLKAQKRKSFQERVGLLASYRKIRIKQILHEDYSARLGRIKERVAERKKQIEQATSELAPLREAVQRIQNASMMDKLKKGYGKDDLAQAQRKLEEKSQGLKRLQTGLTALTQEALRIEASAPISGEEQTEFNLAAKRIEELGGVAKVEDAVEQYTAVNEKDILASKLFIGTTLSGALCDPRLRGIQFDLVMVDDAESIPLPFLIALGAMAKEKMVVSGDPYQLGPDSTLGTPDALQWLQHDIFLHITGKDQLPTLFDYTQQHGQWCVLLSSHFASTPKLSQFVGSVIFDEKINVFVSPKAKGKIYFIDTSVLRSEAKQYFGRRKIIPHNELHTRKLLELMKHALMETGRNAKDLGIVVPFHGPGMYIKQQLRMEGISNVEVGTPHSFRGRRKKAILLDTVMAGVDYTMRPIDDRKVGEHQIVRLLNTIFSCVEEDLYVLVDMNHLNELYADRLLAKFLTLLKAQADPTVNFAQAAKEYDALDWDKKAMLLSPTPEAAGAIAGRAEEESALKDDAEFAVQMKLIAKKEGAKPDLGARNFEKETFAALHRALGMWTDVNLLSQYAGGDLLFHHTFATEQALTSLPISPCLSEKDFRARIDEWNLLLVQMSGGEGNDGPFFKNSPETKTRWDTIALSRFYSGEGNAQDGKNSLGAVVSKIFQGFIGKPAPSSPQEWHTAYLSYVGKVGAYLNWISSELRK